MSVAYPYSIQDDFPQGAVDSDALTVAINNSTIAVVLEHIDTSADMCNIWFESVLSNTEEDDLDAIVSAHIPVVGPVFVNESVITYLENGDIDKIETTTGTKMRVDQFNYDVDGEFSGVTATLEEV